MSFVGRLDGYQRRHGWLGFPLAVVYKFFEDQGNYLAAIITYYGFLSLFPLLLLFVTILGFVLRGDAELQARLLHSAVAQFPIVGGQLQRSTHTLTGSGVGLVIGVVAAIYGGLGVMQAAQNAFNRAWAVPRQDRPDPLRSRARSVLLLPVLGLGVLLTTGLSGFISAATTYLGRAAQVGGTVLSVALNVAIFLIAYRLLTAAKVSVRDVAPGAILAGICWQVLQSSGTYLFAHALRGASAAAGTFGVVLGLLIWIYVQAVITVFCAEINVVLALELWPRALLSLFADTRHLTEGDKAAYRAYPRTERYKTFQRIDVGFTARSGKPSDPDAPDEGRVPESTRTAQRDDDPTSPSSDDDTG